MRKVIYTKYSNDRAQNYQILTRIMDADGQRSVEKLPLTELSEHHVAQIYNWYGKLSAMCAGTKLHVNTCHMDGKKAVFEYIEGAMLKQYMTDYFKAGQYDAIYALFDEYTALLNQLATCEFQETEAFREVFGDAKLPSEAMSLPVSDIDMIFSNIIVNETGWHLIDYEWTYDFPVPVRFILYRTIHEFVYSLGNYAEIKQLKLFERAGMIGEEQRLYEEMEQHFQTYVKAGHHTLQDMYGLFGKNRISAWTAVEADYLREQLNAQQTTQKQLEEENAALQDEINRLRKTLDDIYSSKKWKLVTKLAKLRTGGK